MKKYLKVMLVLVVALSLLCTFAFAAANPFEAVKNAADAANAGTVGNAVNNIGGKVINIIQAVGYVIAVVMVLILAIQWLIGTPAKKQELKAKMWSVLIGAVLLIAGVSILGVVANFAEDVETEVNKVTSIETAEVRA